MTFDESFRSHLRELLTWRRDVRRFRTDPLPAGAIERLIDIGCLAPSVGLSQPWRFVIVDDPERRRAVLEDFKICNADALSSYADEMAARYAKLKLSGLQEAPCQLAVFAEPATKTGHGLGRRTMPQTAEYSVILAIHTMWLAARAEGIGMGWVSILDPSRFNALLEVPEEWKLMGYFCIGYPETESTTPELQSLGWETRQASASLTLRR